MRKITDEFIDALHRLEDDSDVDTIAALFADNAVLSNPLTVHDEGGSEAAAAFWTAYRGAFEHVSSEFVEIVEGNESAMLEWRSDATVNGQPLSYAGVSVLAFKDAEITSFRTYFDPRQLVAHIASPHGSEDLTPSDVQPANEDGNEP